MVGVGRHRFVAAVVVVVALTVAVSSCRRAPSSGGSSAVDTAARTEGGASSVDAGTSCAALATAIGSASSTTSSSADAETDDWLSIVGVLEPFVATWPEQLRSDWATFVGRLDRLSSVVDASESSDPERAQMVADVVGGFDDAQYREAVGNISAHFDEQCPG